MIDILAVGLFLARVAAVVGLASNWVETSRLRRFQPVSFERGITILRENVTCLSNSRDPNSIARSLLHRYRHTLDRVQRQPGRRNARSRREHAAGCRCAGQYLLYHCRTRVGAHRHSAFLLRTSHGCLSSTADYRLSATNRDLSVRKSSAAFRRRLRSA